MTHLSPSSTLPVHIIDKLRHIRTHAHELATALEHLAGASDGLITHTEWVQRYCDFHAAFLARFDHENRHLTQRAAESVRHEQHIDDHFRITSILTEYLFDIMHGKRHPAAPVFHAIVDELSSHLAEHHDEGDFAASPA